MGSPIRYIERIHGTEGCFLVNPFMIQEDITKGQRVESFLLEGYWMGIGGHLPKVLLWATSVWCVLQSANRRKIRLTIRSARNAAHILRTGHFLCPSADRQ